MRDYINRSPVQLFLRPKPAGEAPGVMFRADENEVSAAMLEPFEVVTSYAGGVAGVEALPPLVELVVDGESAKAEPARRC